MSQEKMKVTFSAPCIVTWHHHSPPIWIGALSYPLHWPHVFLVLLNKESRYHYLPMTLPDALYTMALSPFHLSHSYHDIVYPLHYSYLDSRWFALPFFLLHCLLPLAQVSPSCFYGLDKVSFLYAWLKFLVIVSFFFSVWQMMSVYFCSSSLLKLHYFLGDVNLVCLVFCVMCEKCFRTEDRFEENLSLNNVTLLYTQRPWSPRRRVQVNPSSQHSPNHSSYVPLPYLPKEIP